MIDWNTRAVVLAAGKSTRFKTKKSKLLFNICGRSMILYPLKALEEMNIPMTVVLGHQAEEVKYEIETACVKEVSYVMQEEQRGTGHAVACSQETWDKDTILILYGDAPLLTKEIIESLLVTHQEKKAAVTFCTTFVLDPTGYGRVIEENGKFQIVEEKNCTTEQRFINRINAGIYTVDKNFLAQTINQLSKNQLTGEIYLVDIVAMACEQGLKVEAHAVPYDNVRGVNTLQELWSVEQIKRSEFIKYWMSEGVRFELAQSIHIDINVKIGAGSFIGTGVHLLGNTTIGEECFVGAFTIVENTTIGDNTNIHSHSVVQDSKIGDHVHVGPFARLRKDVELGHDVLIGNFVEIKATKVGDHTRTKHLTYLGDATIGKDVNIGAGTIICNYDGIQKCQTIIEDNSFIGSNNTLIAPLHIGKGAYTAGGSTITDDVPSGSLALGRSKQEIKVDYAKKILEKNSKETETKDEQEGAQKKSERDVQGEVFNFRGATKTESEHNL